MATLEPESVDVERLEAEQRAWLREVLAHNEDLEERVRVRGIRSFYDEANDLLSVSFGAPEPASTESVDDVLYLRVAPETLKIVGIEILGVRQALSSPPFQGIILHLLGQPPEIVARDVRRALVTV
jgi:hypothetical protein